MYVLLSDGIVLDHYEDLPMYAFPIIPPRDFSMRTEIEGFVCPAVWSYSLHDTSNNSVIIVLNFPLDISAFKC
jgi:hypothetical protein